MTRSPRSLAIALCAGTVLLLSACGGGTLGGGAAASGGGNCPTDGTQGVTDTTITVGTSLPLSGPVAASGIGIRGGLQSYVDYVNSQGGVPGPDGKKRTLNLIAYDDAATPSRTKTNIDKLIGEDKVFSIVGLYGTANNLAVRTSVDQACMPSIWPLTGAPEIGNPQFPWQGTGGLLLSYLAEGPALAKYLEDEFGTASVAILAQNDDVGRSLSYGFDEAIKGTSITVAKSVTFETTTTDLTSQATTLAATNADVFIYFGSGGTYQTQAFQRVGETGWTPKLRYSANLAPAYIKPLPPELQDGIYYHAPYQDPDSTTPAVTLYRTWIDKMPEVTKQAGQAIPQAGWLQMQMAVETIEAAKTLTQQGLIDSAHHFTEQPGVPSMFREGITLKIDFPDYPYPVSSLSLTRWDAAAGKGTFIKVIDPAGPVKYVDVNAPR
ncbi:ABC transporter substrate-binding protein [Pseudonocardia sp. RS010]|uniref:ABC transporter substrate-binding protein n=1 Tax=Pseudonocardia sp. RS010 TaxID=3385979 RepID=UPI0039A39000